MNEKEILYSHALDKKQLAFENSMITNTNFLSMDERTELLPLEKALNSSVRTFYYGGYEEAERTIAVFVPSFYENSDNIVNYFLENIDENPISLIKVTKDRFSNLAHRDYLGSLMGLGLKREVIGDIIVCEDGCYIFSLKSIAAFICQNLGKAGRGAVSCCICDISELPEPEENIEEVFLSLASLRLDNVVSASFNLSRTVSSEAINKGIVYVNSVRVMKSDMIVKLNDKVVLRGKGKIILSEIIGQNKKGRIHVNIKRYK